MSTKCLVTQLNQAIDNEGLETLGVLEIKVIGTSSSNTTYSAYLDMPGCTITALDGGSFKVDSSSAESVTSYTFDVTGKTLYFPSSDFRITISNKYNISRIMSDGIVLEYSVDNIFWGGKIKYLNGIGNKVHGNTRYINKCSGFVRFGSPSWPIEGKISDFATLTSLTNLTLGQFIEGNLSELGTLTSLTTLYIYNAKGNVTGTIEDFVSAQCSHGRTNTTSSPISFNGCLQYFKFGNTLWNITTPTTIEWSSASVITVYVGGKQSGTAVYEKGASAEQIATWNAAGKTVTDVTTGEVYPPSNA